MTRTRLMEIFDFTEADVAENRGGRVSPEQTAKLTKKRKRIRFWLLLLGLGLWIAGGVLVLIGLNLRDSGDPNWIIMIAVAGIVCGLPGLLLVYSWLKPMQPATLGVTKGPVKVARVQRSSRSGGTSTTYVVTELHVNDRIFWIPDEAYAAFTDGNTYAIYYWDGLYSSTGKHHIFSVEHLSG